jgi:hypothetical protein
VYFLLVCNIGEILIIFFSMLFGMPNPLLPVQLLWLNLVTDGALALALGLEKGEPDIMQRPPRPTREPVVNKEMLTGLIVVTYRRYYSCFKCFCHRPCPVPKSCADGTDHGICNPLRVRIVLGHICQVGALQRLRDRVFLQPFDAVGCR